MQLINLMSGSSGNSTIIKSDDVEIMIDAGGSFKKIAEKYKSLLNKDLTDLNGLFISHEHGDHITGAGIIGRKLKCPIFIPEKSYEKKKNLFNECIINYINGGETIKIKHLEIKPFNTRHDSEACVGFVIIDTLKNKKLGYLTDTGSITKLIKESLRDCNAYMIEADYDEEGLEKCAEYDDILKERIRSDFGHLSNDQALDFIYNNINIDSVDWILFSHLSEKTNSPDILMNKVKYKFPERYWNKFHVAESIELKIEG